jgi:Bax protein
LLPHALLVREETLRKRERLETILGKINCSLEDINFTTSPVFPGQCSWHDFLADDEESFVLSLSRNYRTKSAKGLLERVDAVPISIILAQGAIESSWGSSRFSREGNSIFGMWTWKTKGIVPLRREEGKTHKVKAYDNVLESVRAYHLTLNRLEPYEDFRLLRNRSDDPLVLAEGLTPYSERGEKYVEDIKKVILYNGLQKYDSFKLSDLRRPDAKDTVSESGSAGQSDKSTAL